MKKSTKPTESSPTTECIDTVKAIRKKTKNVRKKLSHVESVLATVNARSKTWSSDLTSDEPNKKVQSTGNDKDKQLQDSKSSTTNDDERSEDITASKKGSFSGSTKKVDQDDDDSNKSNGNSSSSSSSTSDFANTKVNNNTCRKTISSSSLTSSPLVPSDADNDQPATKRKKLNNDETNRGTGKSSLVIHNRKETGTKTKTQPTDKDNDINDDEVSDVRYVDVALSSQKATDDSDELFYLERAKTFVHKLMNAVEIEIPNSNGMKVLRNIPSLETYADARDIVIRKITDEFWIECINQVNDPYTRRVVAVGSPGIGKSTSIPLLIRKLLKDRKTVVFIIRSEEKDQFYYEFVPSEGDSVITNVYPETKSVLKIDSLRSNSTYYIVDPGEYSGSCNPSRLVKASVIIVASPDEKHWGGSEFEKERGGVSGVFQYYPLWSLDEILCARESICNSMSAAEVRDGYRLFGGIPRKVFDVKKWDRLLTTQDNCINLLSADQARQIALGEIQAIGMFDVNAPKSAILGFARSKTEKTPFSAGVSVIISIHVVDKIRAKFMSFLWNYIYEFRTAGFKIFESYCRFLLGDNKVKKFKYRRNGQKSSTSTMKLGGCTRICLAVDPVAEALNQNQNVPFVIFHSTDRQYKLIDFLYKDRSGHFHAFQVTLSEKHTANVKHIKRLEARVGGASKLSLYYLVPSEKYDVFKTKPVDPNVRVAKCNIWVVMIKPPNEYGDSQIV
jgi:hypothetical protein